MNVPCSAADPSFRSKRTTSGFRSASRTFFPRKERNERRLLCPETVKLCYDQRAKPIQSSLSLSFRLTASIEWCSLFPEAVKPSYDHGAKANTIIVVIVFSSHDWLLQMWPRCAWRTTQTRIVCVLVCLWRTGQSLQKDLRHSYVRLRLFADSWLNCTVEVRAIIPLWARFLTCVGSDARQLIFEV